MTIHLLRKYHWRILGEHSQLQQTFDIYETIIEDVSAEIGKERPCI